MAQPLFIAVEPFDPSDGEKWRKYVDWAKIPRLQHLVTLDSMLCRRLVTELEPEDWEHIVNEHFRLDYFYDLEYLLNRVAHFLSKKYIGRLSESIKAFARSTSYRFRFYWL